jgi:enterochelin esterase-like enzyme
MNLSKWFLMLALCSSTHPAFAAEEYKLGPDSMPREGVPRGQLTKYRFENSRIFPGTVRDYWIYVPQQYDASKPACLMVFQDGGGYASTNGQFRVPVVFDNLIQKKEMPVTIGVFVNPGEVPAAEPGQKGRSNRSYEYDSLGDTYARFLLDEFLPEVEKKVNVTKDPEGRAICGISSSGICAWTVAWERPDSFRKVLSHIGSFTNIRGGNNYPALIRKNAKKPIRVFLQDGDHDLDNLHGNWPLSSQEMAAALKFKGYDYKFELGHEGHNGKHGGAILPDSLRWLWRDYKTN